MSIAPDSVATATIVHMDIREVRRGQLMVLLGEHKGKGRQAALAERIGKAPAQISQWVNRTRTITEETAREIEAAAGKPERWMDRDASGAIYIARESTGPRDVATPKLPFSGDLISALNKCDKAKLRIFENTMRLQLEMPLLPAIVAKRQKV